MGTLRPVVVLALCAAALVPAPSSAAAGVEDGARPRMCHGKVITIADTGDTDILRGTPGPDVIAGFAGNDTIHGLGGNDVLCGGRGADTLWGGPGNDRIYGDLDELVWENAFADTLSGGPGDDILDGGYDNRERRDPDRPDLIDFRDARHGVRVNLTRGWAHGQGNDQITLRNGSVFLSEHADRFVGTNGPDHVVDFGGKDHVRTGRGADRVDVGEGEQWISTGSGADLVWAGKGDSTIHLGPGRDHLYPGEEGPSASVDRLYLGPGSDTVWGEQFSTGTGQLVDAGPQDDPGLDVLYMWADSEDRDFLSTWDMASGEMQWGEAGTMITVTHFESAEVLGRWTIYGTANADQIATIGTIGSSFYGRSGDDTYSGSYNDDTFHGGDGHDTYASDTGGVNTCTSVEDDPNAVCAVP